MKLKYLLAASIVSLAATTTIATPAFAQETTSSVRGTVTDENGAAVVGAPVGHHRTGAFVHSAQPEGPA